MIAILYGVDVSVDISPHDAMPRQRVTITLENAGALIPTDELQCLIGGLVRVDVVPAKSTAALPASTVSPADGS